ncbi:MAG: hypothetical protein ACI4M9_08700 [Succinivibrio sp.]
MTIENTKTTESIIFEICNTKLSAYQIACKFNVSKSTVDKIGRRKLGKDFYKRRDELSTAFLLSQMDMLRKQQNIGSYRIAEELGISRSSAAKLLYKLKKDGIDENDGLVEIISVDNPAIKPPEPESKNVGSPSAESDELKANALPYKSDNTKIEGDKRFGGKVFYKRSYHREYEHFNRNGDEYHTNNWIKIELNGIRLSFDSRRYDVNKIVPKMLNVFGIQED